MQQLNSYEEPVLNLIDITKSLTAILHEEMGFLKDNRPAEVEQIQKRKNSLTASYQKELGAIKINGGLASAGNGDVVRKLKQESRIFQKTLEKHHRFIKAKKNLSEQMIKDISREVSSQSGPSSKYGSDAKITRKSAASKTTSLAVNKTI